MDALKKVDIQVEVVYVKPPAVEKTCKEIQMWASPAVKGLMKTHAAVNKKGSIYIWDVPCFKRCCYQHPSFIVGCDGWQNKIGNSEDISDEESDTDNEVEVAESDVEWESEEDDVCLFVGLV